MVRQPVQMRDRFPGHCLPISGATAPLAQPHKPEINPQSIALFAQCLTFTLFLQSRKLLLGTFVPLVQRPLDDRLFYACYSSAGAHLS